MTPQQMAELTIQEAERIAGALTDVARRAASGKLKEREWAMELSRAVNSQLAADLSAQYWLKK